jgi:hypothetical protein
VLGGSAEAPQEQAGEPVCCIRGEVEQRQGKIPKKLVIAPSAGRPNSATWATRKACRPTEKHARTRLAFTTLRRRAGPGVCPVRRSTQVFARPAGAPEFAISESRHAAAPNDVVTVGPNALLCFQREHARPGVAGATRGPALTPHEVSCARSQETRNSPPAGRASSPTDRRPDRSVREPRFPEFGGRAGHLRSALLRARCASLTAGSQLPPFSPISRRGESSDSGHV